MQDTAKAKHYLIALETSTLFRRALGEVCAERNIDCQAVSSVAEALAAIERRIPTALVTTRQLAAFSGHSLIAAIRSSPRHRAIPIALITASEGNDELPSHLRPDEVIDKDHDFKARFSQFLEHMGVGVGPSMQDDAAESLHARLDANVLLAEDTRVLQLLVGRILHVAGATVTMVENGAEAVSMALQQKFDLVLMDIEMPVMDGRQAAMLLRQQGIRVPILAVTAHDKQAEVDEFIALGFTGVVHKPVARHELIEACNNACRATLVSAS